MTEEKLGDLFNVNVTLTRESWTLAVATERLSLAEAANESLSCAVARLTRERDEAKSRYAQMSEEAWSQAAELARLRRVVRWGPIAEALAALDAAEVGR